MQTLAYCLIRSRVEDLGLRFKVSAFLPSDEVVKFPIGIGFNNKKSFLKMV